MAHPTLSASRVALAIIGSSDLGPNIEARGATLRINAVKAVQPEVMEQVTRQMINEGVCQFMTTFLPDGDLLIEITRVSMTPMCWVCTRVNAPLHDDGVCYVCRDPNVEPGEQHAPAFANARH